MDKDTTETIRGLCANIEVLMNVIKDPDGGNELAKKMILMIAQNTVDKARVLIGDTVE